MLLISGMVPESIPECLKIVTYGTERMDEVTLGELAKSLPGIDFMSAIEYYNEYLPDNIYMEVICADKFDVNNAEVHLTLIDDTDFSRLNGENMIESIRNANREGFGYVLAQLELPLTEPHFYTVYFTY
jgi:hypothetical protein